MDALLLGLFELLDCLVLWVVCPTGLQLRCSSSRFHSVSEGSYLLFSLLFAHAVYMTQRYM